MLTVEQLIAPAGEIERAMFPDDDGDQLKARVTIWLNEATSRVAAVAAAEVDNATRAYVNFRAFRAVYLRLSALPTSVSITDEGSHGYTADQAVRFGKLADEAYAEFIALVPSAAATVTREARQPGVVAVPTVITW